VVAENAVPNVQWPLNETNLRELNHTRKRRRKTWLQRKSEHTDHTVKRLSRWNACIYIPVLVWGLCTYYV